MWKNVVIQSEIRVMNNGRIMLMTPIMGIGIFKYIKYI